MTMTMTISDGAWRELLRELDDPDHLEFPANYDHAEVRARSERLAARLDADTGCRCQASRDVQDASHHGDVVVPAAHTAGREQITVRISNFGNLAVYSPENLDCYHDAEKLDVLPPKTAAGTTAPSRPRLPDLPAGPAPHPL